MFDQPIQLTFPRFSTKRYPLTDEERDTALRISKRINEAFEELYSITSQDLIDELLDDYAIFKRLADRSIQNVPYIPLNTHSTLIQRKVALEPPEYCQELELTNTEHVNGYQLIRTTKEPFMYFNDFQRLVKLFNDPTEMPLKEFLKEYDSTACSDWSKMDENGLWMGGNSEGPNGGYEGPYFHTFSDDSEVQKHKWSLVRDRNGRLLYKLPFSKKFLLESINHGCPTRQECVRYSNFLGVWIQRKLYQLSLHCFKQICADSRIISHDLIENIASYVM